MKLHLLFLTSLAKIITLMFFLKEENLQKTGAYKIRGAYNIIKIYAKFL